MRTMRNDQEACGAKDARRNFVTHALIFGCASFLLAIVDAFSPGGPWFFWPVLGWGLALAVHALRVYVAPRCAVEDAEDRALAMELGEQHHRHA